jgi:hypothetical protein
MKKTCYGCRALSLKTCNLGYKNETLLINFDGVLINKGLVPLEDCPKPKTYNELLDLTNLNR